MVSDETDNTESNGTSGKKMDVPNCPNFTSSKNIEPTIPIKVKILSIFISISGLALFVITSIGIAGYIYDMRHSIPDPVARGDDLGVGFAMLFGFIVASVCAVALSYPIYKFTLRKLYKSWEVTNGK